MMVRPAVLALDLTYSDHVMRIPDFPPTLFRHEMLRISSESRDGFPVLPIDHRDARSVGIPHGLNAQETIVTLSQREHTLIHLSVLRMVHIGVNRREHDRVIRRLRRFRNESHSALLPMRS